MEQECIICFEIMEKPNEHFKFPCNHGQYMHSECIDNEQLCPLCRVPEITPREIYIIRQENRYCLVFQVTNRQFILMLTCLIVSLTIYYTLTVKLIYFLHDHIHI